MKLVILFLRYAFIVHRTSQHAKRNLQLPTDFHRFGSECRVEYAKSCPTPSADQQAFDQKKIVVSRIPKDVCETDLHYLFANCHVIQYCPARTVHIATTSTKTNDQCKILWG